MIRLSKERAIRGLTWVTQSKMVKPIKMINSWYKIKLDLSKLNNLEQKQLLWQLAWIRAIHHRFRNIAFVPYDHFNYLSRSRLQSRGPGEWRAPPVRARRAQKKQNKLTHILPFYLPYKNFYISLYKSKNKKS